MARRASTQTEQSSLFEKDPAAEPDEDKTITVTHINDEKGYNHYGGRVKRGGMDVRGVGQKGWLGNPHKVADYGRDECIRMYRSDFLTRLHNDRAFANAVYGLKGSVVACHCRERTEDKPACHLDVVRQALLSGVVARACYSHGITIEKRDVEAHVPAEMRGDDDA